MHSLGLQLLYGIEQQGWPGTAHGAPGLWARPGEAHSLTSNSECGASVEAGFSGIHTVQAINTA